MDILYSNLFILAVLLLIFFNKQDLICNPTLLNKFFILIVLILANALSTIYRYVKKVKPIKAYQIMKTSIFNGFVGTFGYILFSDLCGVEKIGISQNINIQAVFFSLFMSTLIAIFNEKLE